MSAACVELVEIGRIALVFKLCIDAQARVVCWCCLLVYFIGPTALERWHDYAYGCFGNVFSFTHPARPPIIPASTKFTRVRLNVWTNSINVKIRRK